MKSCSYCGRDNDAALLTCGECGTPLTEEASTSAAPVPAPVIICPKCGTADNHVPTVRLYGSFSVGAFLLGGIPAVLLLNAGRSTRMRCGQCDALFSIRTRGSRVAVVIFWLWVAPTIAIIALAIAAVLRGVSQR